MYTLWSFLRSIVSGLRLVSGGVGSGGEPRGPFGGLAEVGELGGDVGVDRGLEGDDVVQNAEGVLAHFFAGEEFGWFCSKVEAELKRVGRDLRIKNVAFPVLNPWVQALSLLNLLCRKSEGIIVRILHETLKARILSDRVESTRLGIRWRKCFYRDVLVEADTLRSAVELRQEVFAVNQNEERLHFLGLGRTFGLSGAGAKVHYTQTERNPGIHSSTLVRASHILSSSHIQINTAWAAAIDAPAASGRFSDFQEKRQQASATAASRVPASMMKSADSQPI